MTDSARSELLRTKFNAPRLPGDVIPRPALENRLCATIDKPLTVLCAGAGFGKTTLLAAWLQECSTGPAAWLALDRGDRDLLTFLEYVVEAVRTIFPRSCARVSTLVQVSPPPDALVVALANDLEALRDEPSLAGCKRFVLVLDDYHLAASLAVNEFIAALLRRPPSTLHLIISSREDPALPLSQLRAAGEMVEIRGDALLFSAEEVAEFVPRALAAPVDTALVSTMVQRTEGWAAGLRLATFSLLHSQIGASEAVALPDHDPFTIEYLVHEVVGNLPPGFEPFLLETAILDWMTGALCEAVTETETSATSAQARLEWLERANLFTYARDAQGTWYRYHQLFRTALLHRLKREYSAERIAALHARASDWYAANGLVDNAIQHAWSSGDQVRAMAIAQAHRHDAINQEHWLELQRWLGLMPRDLIDSNPELLLIEAWVLHHQASLVAMAACLAKLEALLQQEQREDEVHAILQGEFDVLTSQLTYWSGDAERTLALDRRAMAVTPDEHYYVRSVAAVFAAGALQMRGDASEGIALLHDELRKTGPHSVMYEGHLLMGLCLSYWALGDLPNLTATADYLLDLAREHNLPESTAWACYFLGCARYYQNDLGAAHNAFAAVIEHHGTAHGAVFRHSVFGLASVQLAMGLPDRARATDESLVKFAYRVKDPPTLANVEAFKARLALSEGRAGEAFNWAANAKRYMRLGPMPLFYVPAFSLVEILLAEGTPASLEEASRLVARLEGTSRDTHNTLTSIKTLALKALLHAARGETAAAFDTLREAVAFSEPGGSVRVFVDLGPNLAALLQRVRVNARQADYLRRILAAFPSADGAPVIPDQSGLIEPLSERELEVLSLLNERLSNKEIGSILHISSMTVKRHASNIYEKLAVDNRRDAIIKAIALGILSPVGSRLSR